MKDPVALCVFVLLILSMAVYEIATSNRKQALINGRQVFIQAIVWILLAILFNVFLYYYHDKDTAFAFFTGFIISKILIIENMFVVMMLLSAFHVSFSFKNRLLSWGIAGALLTRMVVVAIGVEFLQVNDWLMYISGGVLVSTGIYMVKAKDKWEMKFKQFVQFAERKFGFDDESKRGGFFRRHAVKIVVTPLVLMLVTIAGINLVFAVESVSAVMAISDEAFVVYASNLFAALGLRSLYLSLSEMNRYFHDFNHVLLIIVVFIGIRMCAADVIAIPRDVLLFVMLLLLCLFIVALISLLEMS
ncbi:MAG: hypothetical protein ABIS36_22710 [Chryseolinea sp.]